MIRAMDIIFTTVGVILLVAVWPALVLYTWNDPMLRSPRRTVTRHSLCRRRPATTRPAARPTFGPAPRRVAG